MTDASPPRLTRLELHGFKSFATKTVFIFEQGINAIIGPNGSGKSNVADGVRWALGEQSYGTLRGKKTDDVIFAGGQGKAPAGMAEVTLTFDNSTGWLPSDYSEVTVTRRAYRGGENQYLINGRRVRLRDIQHLTASLGSSHVVVGQGLVDAALAQRAEDRMALFEHAADLTGLRLKASEAEKSLNETEANSARIRDVLTEVEPRLKSLERAARQSREYIELRDRRRALQWRLERDLLATAREQYEQARAASVSDEHLVEAARSALDQRTADLAAARQAADAARAAFDQHGARAQAIIDQTRRVGHERDLATERVAALRKRRADMAETQTGLDEQFQRVETELAAVAAGISGVDRDVQEARQRVRTIETRLAGIRSAGQELERRAQTIGRTIAGAEQRQHDLTRRRALRKQRQETDSAEQQRLETAASGRNEQIARLAADLAALGANATADTERLRTLDDALTALSARGETIAQQERQLREAVDTAEREVSRLTARLEALQRLHESGAGLFAGVRAVTQGAKTGQLNGIRGPVVELVEAPARYETAIEVALGGHLQDIVVDRWADAETAIAYLKQRNAGRATFQPLDTVRGRRDARALPAEISRMPQVHGIAAELVGADADLDPVLWSLLGRTLVVDDLATTRAALRALPGGWSVVTLTGEIARSSGAVTGGAAVKESGMLGRERELRELPVQRERQERLREAALTARQQARGEASKLANERRALETERAGLLASRKEQAAQEKRIERWLTDLRREQQEANRHLASLSAASASATDDLAELDQQLEQNRAELVRWRAELDAQQGALDQQHLETGKLEQERGAAQRDLAGLEERLRGERRRETNLRAQQQALTDELALRNERAAALDGELTALAAQLARLEQDASRLDMEQTRVLAERPPLESAAREAIQAVSVLEQQLEIARETLLTAERQHGARTVGLERVHSELRAIEQRIRDDLELEDPSLVLTGELPAIAGALPATQAETEQEIQRLRDRMRRVGYAGEHAVEEYEREAARHEFLLTQLADVEGASAALRRVLADLHATMRTRFDETFARVSIAFTEMFSTLFGGGSARLVVVGGEAGETTGIDIVAQPPGKRLQNLALLSGGERSLTAVALLFAILRVNPTPFCLLDEVDAALDEGNVVRFREQLRRLSRETQAIVITHNRGTTEIADALYGVSMRDDGVSQVLSLRLADVAANT